MPAGGVWEAESGTDNSCMALGASPLSSKSKHVHGHFSPEGAPQRAFSASAPPVGLSPRLP